MSAHKNYIPHIDGIRAISVLAVILFHFHLLNFTGGFIGVDVFFTISGYLIIGSIVGQAEAGKFKASNFWGRRIRRLFPAIFAVLFLSFIAGMLLMSPGDLTKLSRDSLFGLVSLINFTLLGETDYFDLEGFNEPLLHFWSLAVEEQFYLVFPLIALLILALFRKPGIYKKAVVWVLLILSVISLGVAEWAIKSGHALFAYYMMPTRFFQLALGGVLAIWLQSESFRQSRDSLPRGFHDLLVVAGIATIIVLSLAFTKYTPFPGVNAVWPTLAALALLYSGGISRLSPLLENPISAHLGKLSYSLYLVHWPVWTFMCYYFDRTLTPPETGIALLATYLISLFIYKCVETPVRFSPAFAGKRLYAAVAPASVAAAGLFFVTIAIQGWPQRLPEDKRDFAKGAAEFHRLQYGGRGYRGDKPIIIGDEDADPDLIIIGDSKAQQFGYGLDRTLKSLSRSGLMVTRNGCRFVHGAGRILNGEFERKCHLSTELSLQTVRNHNTDVISIRSWQYSSHPDYQLYNTNDQSPLTERDVIRANINYHKDILKNMEPGRTLTIVSDTHASTTHSTTIAECLSRPAYFGLHCMKRASSEASHIALSSVEGALRTFARDNDNVKFLMPKDVYCENGRCRQIAEDGVIIFSDPGHLSRAGSLRMAPKLLGLKPLNLSIYEDPIANNDTLIDKTTNSEERDLVKAWISSDNDVLQSMINDYVNKVSDTTRHDLYIKNLWEGKSGFSKNRSLALTLAEKLSEKYDSRDATYIAGMAYWVGAATEKDFDKTLAYWNKPSQALNATVQYRMAQIYLDDTLPQYNREKGLEKLRIAIIGGNKDAKNLMVTLGD